MQHHDYFRRPGQVAPHPLVIENCRTLGARGTDPGELHGVAPFVMQPSYRPWRPGPRPGPARPVPRRARRSSRIATGDRPNVKFSNSPGKETIGGYLRVYGRDDALVVADASEPPQGEPLFVRLVEEGRIVYRESFQEQADRADRTWERYSRWEMSPKVTEVMARFRAMHDHEIGEAKARLIG